MRRAIPCTCAQTIARASIARPTPRPCHASVTAIAISATSSLSGSMQTCPMITGSPRASDALGHDPFAMPVIGTAEERGRVVGMRGAVPWNLAVRLSGERPA